MEQKIKALGGIEITKKSLHHNEIEKYLSLEKLELPKSYIEFSLKYGFGYFNNDIVCTSINNIPIAYKNKTFPVGFIYGWGTEDDSLQDIRDTLIDQIPKQYFVFAEATSGDYLMINTINNKIYYYYHEGEIDNSIFLVANSFEDFINNLQVNPTTNSEDNDIEEEWFSDDF